MVKWNKNSKGTQKVISSKIVAGLCVITEPITYTLETYFSVVNCCQFDDSRVVSGSADSTVKIWSTLSGRCLKTLPCSGEVVSVLPIIKTVNFLSQTECNANLM